MIQHLRKEEEKDKSADYQMECVIVDLDWWNLFDIKAL